jgi:imidazoleglycerol-phosphate dehydratase
MRTNTITRSTNETQINLAINLDGTGSSDINSGNGFLDHLLKSLATHALFDIQLHATGDLTHHIVEDIAICLGTALREALTDSIGITRFGYALVPMDDSLALAALDLVKRPYVKLNLKLEGDTIEDLPTEDIRHFFETFTLSLQATIHLWVFYGQNDHHKIEAVTKALALAFKQACAIDPARNQIPSTKGIM